jgi:hypothetical protein
MRIWDSNVREKFLGSFPGRMSRKWCVETEHLDDLPTDAVHWVQRSQGILENQGNLGAPDFLKLSAWCPKQVSLAAENNLAFTPWSRLTR